jgi:hypothetical protein
MTISGNHYDTSEGLTLLSITVKELSSIHSWEKDIPVLGNFLLKVHFGKNQRNSRFAKKMK